MEPTVFLFDLDGVLVQPGGYRAAVRATVNYFAKHLGLGNIAPADETVAIFEAQGITCEWDMVPILLTLALNSALSALPDLEKHSVPLDTFQSACEWLNCQPLDSFGIDFAPLLRGLDRFVKIGEAPADFILALCQDGSLDGPFRLLAGQGVFKELLANTRRLPDSRTTRVFENFALGDAVFSQATRLPAEVLSESLLARNDIPLLSVENRERLVALRAQGRLSMAAYTARPSLPLGKPEELLAVYMPEAEMALNQIGIVPFPLMGSGQMGEAARALGELEDRLTKPAPYHAIAAVVAAWTNDREAALDWTKQTFRFYEKGGGQRPALQTLSGELPKHLNLHIFEDSSAGMRGGKRAAELFADLGMDVLLHLWGVSAHPEKAAALKAVGAEVFPDVNQALEAALRTSPAV